jgi:hypothetical protein
MMNINPFDPLDEKPSITEREDELELEPSESKENILNSTSSNH